MKIEDIDPYVGSVLNASDDDERNTAKVELYEEFIKQIAKGGNAFYSMRMARKIIKELYLDRKT